MTTKDFRKTQREFAEHIRSPETNPAPEGIEDRRLRVYQRLVFNNVKGFIEDAFPVLWRIMGESRLEVEVTDFLRHHRAESPFFIDIAEEFLTYLLHHRAAQADDPPFLIELAHYEWIEFEVAYCQTSQLTTLIDSKKLQLTTPITLSDSARPLQYQFPVHQIQADFQPQKPTETPCFLLVYRDLEDEVKFMEINSVTANLLQTVASQPGILVSMLIEKMKQLIANYSAEVIEHGTLSTLADLAQRGVIRQRVQPITSAKL